LPGRLIEVKVFTNIDDILYTFLLFSQQWLPDNTEINIMNKVRQQ